MSAAAFALPLLVGDEDVVMPKRPHPSQPDLRIDLDEQAPLDESEPLEHWTARALAVRAINSTLALAQDVGRLTQAVSELESRLKTDYEDTQTRELKELRSYKKSQDDRDRWFKRIMTAVVSAIAVAEALHWLGLPGMGH